ncbi:MAG: CopG family antitoxin [Rickettsiales bacterium]
MKKKFPVFKTDEEAGQFLETADLTEYDLSGFKPLNFEFAAKDERITMRLPSDLLSRVKEKAMDAHIPYQRFIRQLIEQGLR